MPLLQQLQRLQVNARGQGFWFLVLALFGVTAMWQGALLAPPPPGAMMEELEENPEEEHQSTEDEAVSGPPPPEEIHPPRARVAGRRLPSWRKKVSRLPRRASTETPLGNAFPLPLRV